jgi:hypothetical protein
MVVVVVATTLWISKTVMIPMLTFIGLLSDTVEIHVDGENPFFVIYSCDIEVENKEFLVETLLYRFRFE